MRERRRQRGETWSEIRRQQEKKGTKMVRW